MHPRSFSELNDPDLMDQFKLLVARDRATTAELLDCLAEVDRRQLYRQAGYPSMFVCCVREYAMSEDMAYKRIRAARTARRFPAVLAMLADGRLHLTAVVLLSPHLTLETVEELLAEAVRKTKAEIEELLARRFPRPDLPTRLTRCGAASSRLVPEPVCMTLSEQALRNASLNRGAAVESKGVVEPELVPEPVRSEGSAQLVPEPVHALSSITSSRWRGAASRPW